MFRLVAASVVYTAGVFLTFGYAYATYSCDRPYITEYMCRMDRDLGPVFKGLFWPIYWAGYGSIKIFEQN